MRRAALILALGAGALGGTASAQGQQPVVTVDGTDVRELTDGMRVAVDADDTDEDGIADADAGRGVPAAGLPKVAVDGQGVVELRTEGGVRLLRGGRPLGVPVQVRAGAAALRLQGVRASERPGDATLVVEGPEDTVRVPITVVGMAVLDARNDRVDPTRDAVGVSHSITNDASLSRRARHAGPSADPDNVRVEIWDPSADADQIEAVLESGPGGGSRYARTITLERPSADRPFRSSWLRLVGDEMDQQAPGVGDRLLRVSLRDEVRIRYPARADGATQAVRVGRPGDERGPRAARRARLRVHLLRATPGGMPVVGGDDAGALEIGHAQVAIANEIWLQCFLGFGDPDRARVRLADPPPAWLISVADRDGLPARGGGTIELEVEGRPIAPITTVAGASPLETALAVARAVRALGDRARVVENPATEYGTGRSADVMVRDAEGAPVEITAAGDAPPSTDARQKITIGSVDLSDGLEEFDNMTATAGTLEERTLVRSLADDDPATLELVVVNHFTGGTRQGEAFIEADGGAITNVVILDRNGIRQQREAWTQSHELGHVLLDQPFHPDNVGPDRPWLLMDADNSLGLVTGPKRLTEEECIRARDRSGVDAVPSIFEPMDPRDETPTVGEPFDPGYPRE